MGGRRMNIMDITQLISTVGFPIVCVIGLAFYIWYKDKADRVERKETQQMLLDFSDNVKQNTESTKLLIELITKIFIKKKDDEDDENK